MKETKENLRETEYQFPPTAYEDDIGWAEDNQSREGSRTDKSEEVNGTGLIWKKDLADEDWGGSYAGLSWSKVGETYQILGELGSGSGGIVYKAYHKRLRKFVVLKKVKIPHHRMEENRKEADILKGLRHSCLPGVLDFIDIGGEIYTVMDYIEGSPLSRCLQRGQRFSQEEAVRYVSQLLEALAYLHGQTPPVLHGDIKPSNIMLTPAGDICLIDFNVSGYLANTAIAVSGYTEGYAAPEQEKVMREAIRSGIPVRPGAVDERSDLYSVGAVLYTLLTGEKPSTGSDSLQKMQANMEAAGISDGIIYVLSRALQPSPEERYDSAAHMLVDLKNYRKLEKEYIRRMRMRRILVLCIAVCVIIVVVVGFVLFQRNRNGKERTYQEVLAALERMADEIGAESQESDSTIRERSLVSAYEEASELYADCEELYPDRMSHTVEMARFLYQAGEYEECRRFIRENLVQDAADAATGEEAAAYGKLYYLLGNCYDQMGSPEEAVQAYALAIEKDDTNPDYYRDYAIALARTGNSTKAGEVLETAEQNGLAKSRIALVHGEILLEDGQYEEAIEAFRDCLNKAQSDEERLRAYLQIASAYEQMGISEENMHNAAELLEEAEASLPTDMQAPVLERLAQAYIHLYDLTENGFYAEEGISVFQTIIQNGWSGPMTYNNIVLLLQRTGWLEEAWQYANEMLSKYPEDYRAYKRAAFLENARQENLDVENRDYSQFVQYYQEAEERYAGQASGSEDTEMRILRDAYEQLILKGWLSGE